MRLSRRTASFALALAVGLCVCAQGSLAQTLYKSVGPDGRVVYSDQPPVAGAVEKTMKLESLPVSVVPGTPVRAAAPAPGKDEAAAAVPRGEVVLYMAQWCGYCKAAKAYLAQRNIAYRELDIDTPAGKTAFAQIGGRGVPVLLTRGQRVTGFSPQAYDALLVAKK